MLVFSTVSAGIVADHNAVAQFDSIPQQYIDSVKHMLLYIVGESHSTAYGFGIEALAAQNPKYPGVGAMFTSVEQSGIANPSYPSFDPQNPRLRIIRGWGGEATWYSATVSKANMLDAIRRYDIQGVSAIGLGWCWDMTWVIDPKNKSENIDPVYRVHWYGRSANGPQGDRNWGLDAEDSAVSGNSVCMDTYLQKTQAYVDSSKSRGYKIRPYFSTGPVDRPPTHTLDNPNEQAYVRTLKYDRIRAWIKDHPDNVLFDFADILSYNNEGELATGSWTDDQNVKHTYPTFHTDNGVEFYAPYHFGKIGAQRIAKATWWMLARMAGWSGIPDPKKKTISLKVMPEDNITLGTVSLTQQFTATAQFEDNSESDVTGECTWLSQNSAIVESKGAGLFIAKSAGNVNVLVSYSTFTDTIIITAVAPTVDSLYFTPKRDTVKFLDTLRFSSVAFDQYEKQMGSLPNIEYSVKGTGTIDPSGLYHAPSTNTVDTVIAKSGAVVSKAVISILGATNYKIVDPKKGRQTTLTKAQEGYAKSFNTMGRMVGTKKEKYGTAAGYAITKQNSTNKPSSSIIFHDNKKPAKR
jgi:hypothetical protein